MKEELAGLFLASTEADEDLFELLIRSEEGEETLQCLGSSKKKSMQIIDVLKDLKRKFISMSEGEDED